VINTLKKNILTLSSSSFCHTFFILCVCVLLGFELIAFCLVGSGFTTGATPPAHFCFSYLSDMGLVFLPRASLRTPSMPLVQLRPLSMCHCSLACWLRWGGLADFYCALPDPCLLNSWGHSVSHRAQLVLCF
jgi:hypothetical protein